MLGFDVGWFLRYFWLLIFFFLWTLCSSAFTCANYNGAATTLYNTYYSSKCCTSSNSCFGGNCVNFDYADGSSHKTNCGTNGQCGGQIGTDGIVGSPGCQVKKRDEENISSFATLWLESKKAEKRSEKRSENTCAAGVCTVSCNNCGTSNPCISGNYGTKYLTACTIPNTCGTGQETPGANGCNCSCIPIIAWDGCLYLDSRWWCDKF